MARKIDRSVRSSDTFPAMSDVTEFAITATWSSSDVVIALSGELDLAASAGWDASVSEVLGQQPSSIVVDLGATTFVDSSGLRLLVLLTQQAHQRSVPFHLVNVPAAVTRLLEITGLTEMMNRG
jgi:anti-sigma B factor antagonist